MRNPETTQVLSIWSARDFRGKRSTAEDLQETNTEDGNQNELLVQGQLQLVQVGHRQSQHRYVSDQVNDTRNGEARNLVTAGAAWNLSPVHGDGLADQEGGENSANSPGRDQAHEDPCYVLDGRDVEHLGVENENGDLRKRER